MYTDTELQDAFISGVKIKLESLGSQAELARKAGIAPSYVSDILCKRRTGSEVVRRKIASALGVAYEELLAIGRRGIDDEKPIPEIADCLRFEKFSEARAISIYQAAAKEAGIVGSHFFQEESLKRMRPPGWVEYLSREIGDGALYERARTEVDKLKAGTENERSS